MRPIPLLGLSLLLLVAPTVATAKPAYVPSTVNLRAAPGTSSEVVTKIPAGSLVDAGACSEGWCEVTWQDKKGYAIESALDQSGRVPAQHSARRYRQLYSNDPAYEEPPVNYAPPPAVYYEPGPYAYYGYYGPYYRRGWGYRRW